MASYYMDENGKITLVKSDNKKATKKKKKKSTWFKSGAFSDGWQFGDITKTILGTAVDLVEEVEEGIFEIPERVIDAGAYLVGGAGKLFGADGFADDVKGFIAKDLYNSEKIIKKGNILNAMGLDTEKASLLGDKAEGLANSAGELVATVGLQAVCVPWWVTSGVTSFGREVEGAFQQGANYGEAGVSGLVTAGAELLSEKLFGGSGLGEKGFINTEAWTKGISRKGLKVLADFGIDVLSEGGEEVASQFFSTLGQQLTYEKEETWAEILSDEEKAEKYLWQVVNSLFGKEAWKGYGDAFIGGMVLSGGMNTGKAVNSAKSGRDYRTGLTADEEAVVSKETENRIAEAEKSGKKLTNKDKAIIRDQALKALGKGDISIDVIEEVLGGDTYKSYQDAVKNEDAAIKPILDEAKSVNDEFKTLNQMKIGERTGEQTDRLEELRARKAELQEQIKNTKKTSERDFLQKKYKNEAYELAKGSKLEESYNERTRRGQAFTADLTKYKGKQRAIVQKAIDSGILNNTNKTHEFVDLIARIAGDKGVDFDFLNNAKLKESGFALDGVTVNGYFDASTKSIGINLNSAKALNTVVGHEITHVLEGTELYNELQKAVTEYAKTKGEYKGRRDALAELYKNIEGADIDAELTADLVGDYLFTDADFVNNLSANHRNVFQKIYDEIKYLCKIATAGSKEARQLEKVKKTFEDTFRAETKNTAQEGGVRYSLNEFEDGQRFVSVETDQNLFDNLSTKEQTDLATKIIKERYQGKVIGIDNRAFVNGKTADEYTHPAKHLDSDIYEAKMRASTELDNLMDAGFNFRNDSDGKYGHTHSDVTGGFDYFDVIFKVGGEYYQGVINIKNINRGKLLKDITQIRNITQDVTSRYGSNPSYAFLRDASMNSISQNSEKSTQNTKNSLSAQNDDLGPIGDYNVYGKDVALEGSQDIMTREEYDMWRIEELNRLNPQLNGRIKGEIVNNEKIDGISSDGLKGLIGSHSGSSVRRTKNAKVGTFTHEILHTIDMLTGYNVRRYVEDLSNGKGFDNYESLLDYLKNARRQGKIDGRTTNAEEIAQMVLNAFYADRPGLQQVAPEFVSYLENMGLDKYSHLAKNYNEYLSEHAKGEDVALEGSLPDDYAPIGETANSQTSVDSENGNVNRVDVSSKEYISFEDFANAQSPVWRNVEYDDAATKSAIMQEVHDSMVKDGAVIQVSENVTSRVEESFPDLRGMKKKERTPILKEAINKLKSNLRQFLNGFKNQTFEFEVDGKVLEAKLYNTGINEVLEKITQDKASMLYTTEEIFGNARYLYSTPDYDGDPNVYRWNYFYTPVQIGSETVGVRIAVRDVGQGQYHLPESQIYNWGIKKDASLGGVQPVVYDSSHGASSDASIDTSLDGESHGPRVASFGVSSDVSDNIIASESDVVKSSDETQTNVNSDSENSNLSVRRSELKSKIVEDVKDKFNENGLDFDEVLKHAKDLSTFSTVDNTPQRVMEKTLGYKAGGILADLTVNKVAQNETEGIKWLNSITDRKRGLLAQLVKDYGIKPGSKASAAAQMYAEGFYVDKNGDIIEYGDAELKADFPDSTVRENIKKLAKDERVRQFYDETLDAINESRRRNGYPEIQKLDNYFLHFRAMEDTFSRLGLPFNPNDIRAKDLPTDLNGVTADLKPGQPYFASSKHREGKRTSFDLLGGLEKYATSAKNQIYHIDDIQTLRALRNYIADTYGQAKGLENLDTLTEEEVQEKIKEVYGSHLSTFAKFLNEEANVLAGKTALIDRGIEGVIGRRAVSFMDSVNRQVGNNMIGYNVSSALTNLIAPVQAFAKTNKADFIKGFAQTVSNRIKSIKGKGDDFAETSPVVIRRKGSERFHRTAWQKFSDSGYAFTSAIENFSTELIARAKYNELTRKGMDSETAHVETDKWVSRLMGDRSLGQMPQIYNSKMLGLVTKFQLEVRNQLDSQFYDTIQEAKASTEDIENALERNAKRAAKITSTFFTLAVGQHLFGKAFEAVAGYNPAFDIISVLIKALGLDDDEDSDDTVLDNIEQGFFELMDDMPYTSILEGGRIPISSALPIEELYKGEDQYGNDKSRWETVLEALPYYISPGGYGQFKKTRRGLGMFDDDLPVSGSYTDSGKLRFPVDKNLWKVVQAGLFGQYASENARDYFDNERTALNEKQIQEFVDSGISIQDYWEYREGLSGLKTLAEKADYIYGLDIPIEAKNLFINNLSGRKEEIDLSGMEGFESFEEYDYAQSNPGKYAISKAVAADLDEYKQYSKELSAIESDKDENGKTVSGSRKEKVVKYINDLDLDYGQKIILYRSQYKSDNTYNYEIVEYLNGRDDISYETMVAILKELGFTVKGNSVTWD